LLLATPALAQTATPARPAEDVARDANRKPADMVAFAGIKPGMTVIDFLPGGGYFTRVFAQAVGAKGKVVALVPAAAEARNPAGAAALRALAGAGWPMISVANNIADPALAGTADVVWTAQNYHDLHNAMPAEGVIMFNRGILNALKPGGIYVVVDHVAADGAGLTATGTTHRIDPAAIKAEVLAAGFVFDGESNVLRNPADPRTANVFDPSIRGKTDQVVLKFHKP
ncbi:MAG: methyltransferase, partial [Sphingomonadales bacterium]